MLECVHNDLLLISISLHKLERLSCQVYFLPIFKHVTKHFTLGAVIRCSPAMAAVVHYHCDSYPLPGNYDYQLSVWKLLKSQSPKRLNHPCTLQQNKQIQMPLVSNFDEGHTIHEDEVILFKHER